MKKLNPLLLLTALVGLLPFGNAFAIPPDALGGSAFPFIMISQPPINLTDGFNEMLQIINAQCAAQSNSPALTVQDSVFTVQNSSDATKQLVFSLAGAATATKLTFADACTNNCTLTTPIATDTIAGLATSETFTGTDTFTGTVTLNSALAFGAAGTVQPQGIPYSTNEFGNPLVLHTYDTVSLASINSGTPLLASAASRAIHFAGPVTMMASGTAAGATSVELYCKINGGTDAGTIIASFPIAWLVNNAPIFESGATGGLGYYSAFANGCAAGSAVYISANGTLTTTTQLFVNLPYTLQ